MKNLSQSIKEPIIVEKDFSPIEGKVIITFGYEDEIYYFLTNNDNLIIVFENTESAETYINSSGFKYKYLIESFDDYNIEEYYQYN